MRLAYVRGALNDDKPFSCAHDVTEEGIGGGDAEL